jgi:parallel beta-helix repeat protein
MRKKLTNTTIALLAVLMFFGILTATPSSAITYTNSKGTVKVVCGTYSHTFNAKNYGKNFSRTLNYALYTASRKATSKKKATVTISKGNYRIDRVIYIYSNTTLIATGSTFTRRDNIISNGYNNSAYSAKGYSGASNITIKGGTWDIAVPYSQANTTNTTVMHSTFRFGHCSNITISGCTFKNNYNCHDIEMGGVNNAVIKNCTFSNDKNVNKFVTDGGKEAVQIDLNTQPAVPYFPSYDYTTSKNITIKNNTFKNKYRAIGSHHAMIGTSYDNISVYGNTFDNIAGYTIYAVYWTNSKIYNNTFNNVGSGIDIRPMIIGESKNFYNYKKLSYLNSEYTTKNAKTYVYGNTINVRKITNTCEVTFGIRVYGMYLASKDTSTGINAGEYDAYNINLGVNANGTSKPNKISGNLYYGIYVGYGNKCNIKNNTIDLADCQKDYSYGIAVKGSKNTTVSNNTISNGKNDTSRGVYVGATGEGIPSESTSVTKNNISNFNSSGLFVSNSSDTTFSSNTSTNSKYGVAMKGAVNTTVKSNTLNDCSSYGVYSYYGSTGTKITNNTIASDNNAIFLNDTSDLYPNEEKNLTVSGNTMNCPESVTPVSLKNSNLVARVYDNYRTDKSYAACRIKGSDDVKYTYCYSDFLLKALGASGSDNSILLSWDSVEDVSGYRIYRTVYDNDATALCDVENNSYEDTNALKYMSDQGISYSASPYLSSVNIKLLGESTPVVTVNK